MKTNNIFDKLLINHMTNKHTLSLYGNTNALVDSTLLQNNDARELAVSGCQTYYKPARSKIAWARNRHRAMRQN